MSKPTIHLVDDDADFRKSTRWLLQSAGHHVIDVDSAAGLLEELTGKVIEPGSACIVSDIRMPTMSGLELQQALNKRPDRIPLILVTGHGDVPMAVKAMQQGAANFIEKPFSEQTILDAISAAVQTTQHSLGDDPEAQSKIQSLTPREREVLDLVVAGRPNKLIADELSISIKTVEMHRANMKAKLGVKTLPALMQLVFDAGLGKPEVH